MALLKHLVFIKAPAEKVYRAVTEQEGLASWWTRETTASPEVGTIAEFKFGDRYHNKMRIRELRPDEYVEWECLEGDAEWVGTIFTFELEKEGNDTKVRFAQKNWKEASDFYAHCNYFWGLYMKSLKDFCETGKGDPFV
ncbi:MAG: SRPBCC family protein [Planctomycetota bacterium]|jgi:uncharacterized protein YndB with AHSA1/START domain